MTDLVVIALGHPHSVEGGFQAVVAPVLQSIPNVDCDSTGEGVTGVPQPSLHGLLGCGSLAGTHTPAPPPLQPFPKEIEELGSPARRCPSVQLLAR